MDEFTHSGADDEHFGVFEALMVWKWASRLAMVFSLMPGRDNNKSESVQNSVSPRILNTPSFFEGFEYFFQ